MLALQRKHTVATGKVDARFWHQGRQPGSIYPRAIFVRIFGYVIWVVSAVWGMRLALQHVGIQADTNSMFSCSFSAESPNWVKLDEWWLAVFQPTGYCDDVQWQ